MAESTRNRTSIDPVRLMNELLRDIGFTPTNGAFEIAVKRIELFEQLVRLDEMKIQHDRVMGTLRGEPMRDGKIESQVPASAGH